ncbi:hypothetical protein AAHE18_11G160300 [Arachis hypogaea]
MQEMEDIQNKRELQHSSVLSSYHHHLYQSEKWLMEIQNNQNNACFFSQGVIESYGMGEAFTNYLMFVGSHDSLIIDLCIAYSQQKLIKEAIMAKTFQQKPAFSIPKPAKLATTKH